jgi:hypothetical protein
MAGGATEGLNCCRYSAAARLYGIESVVEERYNSSYGSILNSKVDRRTQRPRQNQWKKEKRQHNCPLPEKRLTNRLKLQDQIHHPDGVTFNRLRLVPPSQFHILKIKLSGKRNLEVNNGSKKQHNVSWWSD